jgi:hypothetical protein
LEFINLVAPFDPSLSAVPTVNPPSGTASRVIPDSGANALATGGKLSIGSPASGNFAQRPDALRMPRQIRIFIGQIYAKPAEWKNLWIS